ncbi:MAG TPA: C2 family cysteine protease [Chitinophagaceae bacterium]|jgi:hypothetical protein|nr:C2 family cysteine protease [Chitinophagaceae bacterium]
MTKETVTQEQAKPETIGVINPYALVESMIGKKINWKAVHNQQKLLEDTLGMPYEKLFDPKHNSPLYAGLKLDQKTQKMVRDSSTATLSKAHDFALNVRNGSGIVWSDPGIFFEEATETSDPIQGGLGDCYFIAALASVAWARTYIIAQRTRATGTSQQAFVDMIEFFKNGASVKIDVTENLPLNSPSNSYIYCRSSETGELWPALYEKAYVFMRKGGSGVCDQLTTADYNAIAGGDPVASIATLTNLTPYYYGNNALSETEIWDKIRQNCLSYKTFNPMVAWTYSTAPAGVNYSSSHIVANHAYSILGWHYSNNRKYVVLRNPWGNTEATLNVDNGTWMAWDTPYYNGPGWWRAANLQSIDGIFALRLDTFKQAFAGFGVGK